MSYAALLTGGLAGVLARYGASRALAPGALPWATLAVNLAGCFLAGLFDEAARRRGWGGAHGRLLLLTGFCGAFTTFSALILELDVMARSSPSRAAGYVILSVAAGLALLRLGAAAGRLA
ncbi:MAG: CrcB family protein [Elusimicrobiota bacterium]|nr:MAG: CrcB family protein [Elusimicrobiota bacterium]